MVADKTSSHRGDDIRRRVNDAVASAEKRTGAEILPVVASVSGMYGQAGSLAALVGGVVAAVVAVSALGEGAATPAFALGFLIGLGLGEQSQLVRRLFVSKATMLRNTQVGADSAFHDRRLVRTDRETVLLFYVSLFERQAVVAADAKVRDAVGERCLDGLRQELQESVRRGRVLDGLLRVIERAGDQLATALPRRAADMDEKPHELVLLDR